MRPIILAPLYQSARALAHVGPKLAALLARLTRGGGVDEARVLDLIFHRPYAFIDRRQSPGISQAQDGQVATLKVVTDAHRPPPRGQKRVPYRIKVHDATGSMELVFFHADPAYLQKALPVGEARIISGKIEHYNDQPQMAHPDYILKESELAHLPLIEPVYPMTAGLSPKVWARALKAALKCVPELPEWQDKRLLEQQNWPDFKKALARLHAPQTMHDLDAQSAHRRRLAYDELLAGQLTLAITRRRMRQNKGLSRAFKGRLSMRVRAALPFSLTGAQEKAILEIEADLRAKRRMLRLLQGDVGAGKTVVALMAMAAIAESGAQSALMAPTELLARQHFQTILPLCEAAGLRAAILTGKDKASERKKVLEALKAGQIDILVGTHALFQENVHFPRLGLIVVDEQHRFGVHQRLSLSAKGEAVDVLVMTATPIPRTLVLTYFGDMDVSKLTEKPAGRSGIETRAVSLNRLQAMMGGLKRAISSGQKAYWVCPLVEEAESLPLTSAEERFASLKPLFSNKAALIHGRMTPREKEAAMNGFKNGGTQILVATTVIEVGVDVAEATIMIIEHAERFGLSQLHQLRGRVGRGLKKSSCILLYKPPLTDTARARLSILRQCEDGFRIAEEDLRLRGEGEVLGVRQSGMPVFRIADLQHHGDLLQIARRDAKLILETDPDLIAKRSQALRVLLYLFGLDETIRYLKAG